MATLLILGSKPDPVLPPRTEYDAVACANAAGFSAAKYGLPTPAFTAMSAILTSGIGSGRQSLEAIRGLRTETLYFIPRPDTPRKLWKKIKILPVTVRTSPLWFRMKLRQVSFQWDTFIYQDIRYYMELISNLSKNDAELMEKVYEKRPSTGLLTLIIGMSLGNYDRFVMSGFNFELTHAYADNPEITQRGTRTSRHTPTDIQLLRRLSDLGGNIFTTEPAVHEQASLPFL